MAETFVNDFATTLNGAIDSAVTALSVNDSPPSGLTANFRIRIDDEFMLVTAIGGTGNKDWTVTREAEESARFPAASHSNAAAVTHVLTAGIFDAETRTKGWTASTDTQITTTGGSGTTTTLHTHVISGAKAGVYFITGRSYCTTGPGLGGALFIQAQGATDVDRIGQHNISGYRNMAGLYTHTADGDLTITIKFTSEGTNVQFGIGTDGRFGRKTNVVRLGAA
jgi:hypothetical protein